MRRLIARLTALACLAAALAPWAPAAAAEARHPAPAAAERNDPRQPPHAWLFGTWTGGLFPAPSSVSAESCLAQPVVIFTRDIVMRASLIEQFYTQRLIETALTTPGGTQFHFTAATPAGAALLADGTPAGAGFGCADPDQLTVVRKSENEISFPNCADFPNPLIRCPSR